MSMRKFRGGLYSLARLLGDVTALGSGDPKRVKRRAKRRVVGRTLGRLMRKI